MRVLALVLALVVSGPAIAQTWLVGTVASYHFDRSQNYNERNLGFGFEYGVTRETRIVGGTYRNSVFQRSTYLGSAWTPLELGPTRAGLVLGAVDGYPGANDGGFFPMAALLGTLEIDRVGVNLLAAPRWRDKSPAVLGLQIKAMLEKP